MRLSGKGVGSVGVGHPSINLVVSVGLQHQMALTLLALKKIVHPGIETLPSALTIGT